jgi:hypothetical protein
MHPAYMDNDTLFKVLAVVSPFASGFITYLLTLKSKRKEYQYQNRLPAFKEVQTVLVKIRKECMGKIAFAKGTEFAPYFSNDGSPSDLRTNLADVRQLNEVFFSSKSKALLDDVDNHLGLMCNAELYRFAAPTREESDKRTPDYEPLLDSVETCLAGMYKEVGIVE